MKLIFLFSISALFIISCEKEIPLTNEQSDPQLVLNCSFLADDIMQVALSESKSILDESYFTKMVIGSSISLYDKNETKLGDFTETGEGNYILENPKTIAGETYEIRAKKDGFKSISAKSSIPLPIPILNLDTTTTIQGNFQFTISLNDPAGINNFYSISFSTHTFSSVTPNFSTKETYVETGYQDIDGVTNYGTDFLFSDKTMSGQNFKFSGERFRNNIDQNNFYVITVKSLSEELYKYLISYDKYSETQENPFAEPVRVYNNIENGLGIFGGSSIFRDTIWVE